MVALVEPDLHRLHGVKVGTAQLAGAIEGRLTPPSLGREYAGAVQLERRMSDCAIGLDLIRQPINRSTSGELGRAEGDGLPQHSALGVQLQVRQGGSLTAGKLQTPMGLAIGEHRAWTDGQGQVGGGLALIEQA